MYKVRKTVFLCSIVFFVSFCKQKIQCNEAQLNGYWIIDKVVFPDGTEKKYEKNGMYDYIEMKVNNQGYRTKVMQQWDDTFLTNNIFETFYVVIENGRYFLEYDTPYEHWKEELLSLSEDHMIIENQEHKQYFYTKIVFSDKVDYGQEK